MSPQPTHRRGAAVTESLLQAALELIAERQSVSLAIEEIADRAGVNKTTAYRRWSDAPSLIRDAVLDRAETSIPLEPTGDVRADLIRLCTDVVDNLESPIGRALIVSSRDVPELDAFRSGFWDARLRAAVGLLGDGLRIEQGEAAIERLIAPLHFRVIERGLPVTSDHVVELVDHFLRGFEQP